MMQYLFYVVVWLFLSLFQTVIIPLFPPLTGYDLFIPFVVYLGLSTGLLQGILLALATGLALDVISAAYFGVYMTIYFWLFLVTRFALAHFQTTSFLFIVSIIVSGVIFEAFLFCSVSWLAHSVLLFPMAGVSLLLFQIGAGLLTGPPLVYGLDTAKQLWQIWFQPPVLPDSR